MSFSLSLSLSLQTDSPSCKEGQKSSYGTSIGETIAISCDVESSPVPGMFYWIYHPPSYSSQSIIGSSLPSLSSRSSLLLPSIEDATAFSSSSSLSASESHAIHLGMMMTMDQQQQEEDMIPASFSYLSIPSTPVHLIISDSNLKRATSSPTQSLTSSSSSSSPKYCSYPCLKDSEQEVLEAEGRRLSSEDKNNKKKREEEEDALEQQREDEDEEYDEETSGLKLLSTQPDVTTDTTRNQEKQDHELNNSNSSEQTKVKSLPLSVLGKKTDPLLPALTTKLLKPAKILEVTSNFLTESKLRVRREVNLNNNNIKMIHSGISEVSPQGITEAVVGGGNLPVSSLLSSSSSSVVVPPPPSSSSGTTSASLPSGNKLKYVSEGNRSWLYFTPQSKQDFGSFECWATNIIGKQSTPCVFHVHPAGQSVSSFLLLFSSSFHSQCL